jgi:energy-coupling factor transporter ATP-binding protein EcfA2
MSKAKTICIYGESGTGKTTQVGFLARYLYEKTGKKTRLISADGGGWNPVQPYIDAGIIEAFGLSALENPIATIRKLSRGYWPNEHGVLTEPSTPKGNNLGLISGYAIEGITSLGDVIMRDLRLKGVKLAQDPGFSFKEGDETFYGSNMTYFGFVQDTLQEIVHSFAQAPVERVLWTALEEKGEDYDSRQPTYGPSIIGKKALAKVPQWFGTLIHHENLVERAGLGAPGAAPVPIKSRLVAYFQRHPDPLTQIPYPAKPRIAPERLADLEKRFPGGFYPLTPASGLDDYLRAEDELGETSAQGLRAWKEGIDAKRAG